MRNGGNFIIIYNTNVIFMFHTKKWHNLLKICSPQSDSYGQLGHNLTAHYLNSKEKKRIRKNRGWEALPYSLQRNMINVDYRVLLKKSRKLWMLAILKCQARNNWGRSKDYRQSDIGLSVWRKKWTKILGEENLIRLSSSLCTCNWCHKIPGTINRYIIYFNWNPDEVWNIIISSEKTKDMPSIEV